MVYDKKPVNILEYHHSRVFDQVQAGNYLRSIILTVKPGEVDLEIGSGTGILTLFASPAGKLAYI